MTKYDIPKFQPRRTQSRRIWLIIGPRNTGKSVLLRDLLYHTAHRYAVGVGMCGTYAATKDMRQIMPNCLVHNEGYNYDVGDKLMATAEKLVSQEQGREVVWVMDDCMFDAKVLKCKTQATVHLNGRHSLLTMFNTTQYSMIVPSVCRGNIDYVIAMRESILANKRRLYEHYFGMFPSFGEFDRVFTKVTANYGAMILDKTKGTESPNGAIRWYRASENIPKFEIGQRKFWVMDKKLKQAQSKKRKRQEKDGGVISI